MNFLKRKDSKRYMKTLSPDSTSCNRTAQLFDTAEWLRSGICWHVISWQIRKQKHLQIIRQKTDFLHALIRRAHCIWLSENSISNKNITNLFATYSIYFQQLFKDDAIHGLLVYYPSQRRHGCISVCMLGCESDINTRKQCIRRNVCQLDQLQMSD